MKQSKWVTITKWLASHTDEGIRIEDHTVLDHFVMPAEVEIQESKRSCGFSFPDFIGMINVGNNRQAVFTNLETRS